MNKFGLELKRLLKIRGIKLYMFEKLMDTNKTMMYRIMLGDVIPSEEWIENASDVLSLSEEEYRNLLYTSTLKEIDEDMIRTREDIFNALYLNDDYEVQDIDMIYYANDRYSKCFSDALNEISNVSLKKGFKCDASIINCIKKDIINPVFNLFSTLDENEISYKIEHMLSFSQISHQRAFKSFNHILHLLALKNYKVKYNSNDFLSNDAFFHDFLIIKYEYIDENNKKEEVNLFISILEDGLSTCHKLSKSDSMYDYFIRNYKYILKKYPFEIKTTTITGYDFNELLANLGKNETVYTFSPNPCYKDIPLNIFEEMYNIMDNEARSRLFKELSNEKNDIPFEFLSEYKNAILNQLKTRAENSTQNPQIEFYTRSGIELFAENGLLADHKPDIPMFSLEQRKEVLKHILSKDQDQTNKFNFYIIDTGTDVEVLNSSMYPFLTSTGSVFLEYNFAEKRHLSKIYTFEDEIISNTLLDFAENFIITSKAMSKKSSFEFINDLINKINIKIRDKN